ncbi:MAG: tyrosine-type recombinase/integrase [Ktedonobacteraceae bacterium]
MDSISEIVPVGTANIESVNVSLRTPADTQALANVSGQLAKSSQRIYASDARAFASWLTTHQFPLDRSAIILYRSHLIESYRPTTARRMWSVACRILREQVKIGQLESDPSEDVRGIQAQGNASKHIALTKEQARGLLDTIDISSKKGLRDYALLLLLLKTGLRRAECVALDIGDMREEQGHHTLLLRETKGSKLDTVKLSVDVWRAIQDYLASVSLSSADRDMPLFLAFRRGDRPQPRRMQANDVYRLVVACAKTAGIADLSPHGLRATFITIALDEGSALHKVQYAARHSDARMTEHYHKRKLNLDDNAVDYVRF